MFWFSPRSWGEDSVSGEACLGSIKKALNCAWRCLDFDPGTVMPWVARAGQRTLLMLNPLLLSLKMMRFFWDIF